MGKFIDLTGRKFGRLTVLRRASNIGIFVSWECLCECGNITYPVTGKLNNGSTKSCGCYKYDLLIKRINSPTYKGKTHHAWRDPIKRLFDNSVPVPESGCLLWVGNTTPNGYGQMTIGGKKIQVHRLSYEINGGDIPDGMLVCHHCDVRSCINPNHLFLGTHKDNTQDMMKKGRHRYGTKAKRHE
jgi:hypothetical protein